MKSKKVAIFYKTFRKYGGQEKVVYEFSHFLAEKGYKVDIWAQKVKDKPQYPRIKIHKVYIPNFGRAFRNLSFATYSFLKAVSLRRKGVIILGFGKTFYQDIFRSGGGVHKFYIERAALKYRNPFKRILYKVRKFFSLSNWINRLIEKLTFENKTLKAIVVPTEFVKQQILSNYKVKARIFLVRNGVDLKRFSIQEKSKRRNVIRKELGIKENDFVFVYVSSNHFLKGLDYLLEACNLLKQKGYLFKLLIAGSGKDKYFEKRVNTLNLTNYIIFLGKRNDIENVYYAGDFFVYPTLFDASANVILEAMACGLPVISSVYSGTHELITEEKNGFLIKKPEDPLEIALKMEKVLKRPELAKTMGKEAFKIVSKYPKERVFDKYERIIKNLT
jgi:UDP-glucose:(heptosyl)LPS alpha-1,3-glucosyltransferase